MDFQKIPSHAKKVYQGVTHAVYQWQQEVFDGNFATFEAVYRPPSVTVLAVTSDKKVLVTRETQPYNGTYTTIPGGVAESYNLLAEAKRELLEETGYESDDWSEFETIDVVSYSRLEWKSHFFVAKNIRRVRDQALDAGELITVMEVSPDNFVELVQKDDFTIDYVKSLAKDGVLLTRLGLESN
jgi:ADP-ribose pyrophosphatase YjhB (NUDIX family)